ncbi:MAG: recombinase family protein, partial [Candidatus Pacebacteria bacterium]|nr:recombinase family protein [Candidatus Paceibacterota bacterium]
MPNYFLYARKSTDDKEKQIHSIEDQVAVLRKLAKKENLNIVEQFEERQSAKIPGRPVFNAMMLRVQKGEAQGILCWKIDRLARNPVDAAQIQWLLQRGTIAHIQTHDRSYYPADNVLLMSVEFGMANQYIRDLSSNTSRGLLQKAKRGEFPCVAPTGYRNNPRTKLVVIDRKKAPTVRMAFELYAKGHSRLEDISTFLYENGVRSLYGNRIHRDRAKFILVNPFYYGHFRYQGELLEGKHTPLISKSLFDKVQKVMATRGHPQTETTNPQQLCGLLSCGECGMHITAETRVKTQKNGNVHRYVYYRCTKKGAIDCSQSYVREETLAADLSDLLSEYTMPSFVAEDFTRRMKADELDAGQAASITANALRAKIADISSQLDRLTDVYIAQDIERHDYLNRRAALLSERTSIEEVLAKCEQGVLPWLEPLQEWVKEASLLDEIAK